MNTDSSVNSIFPSSYDIPYDLPRAGLYDQGALYGTLMKNQMADVFSNSFLLELCNDTGVDKTGIDYVKISNNRNKEFCIYTTISDGYACVTKQPLYQEGKAHLEKMTDKTFLTPLEETTLLNLHCAIRYKTLTMNISKEISTESDYTIVLC